MTPAPAGGESGGRLIGHLALASVPPPSLAGVKRRELARSIAPARFCNMVALPHRQCLPPGEHDHRPKIHRPQAGGSAGRRTWVVLAPNLSPPISFENRWVRSPADGISGLIRHCGKSTEMPGNHGLR